MNTVYITTRSSDYLLAPMTSVDKNWPVLPGLSLKLYMLLNTLSMKSYELRDNSAYIDQYPRCSFVKGVIFCLIGSSMSLRSR